MVETVGRSERTCVLVAEETPEVALTGRAELVTSQAIFGDLEPVVWNTQPLPHDAPVGAMQPE